MPFTFAHPLYIAPLKWLQPSYISLTGLILGSMSPDYEYFIALEPFQSIGHSATGLLFQGIPLSILFACLFHYIIKIPLAEHLPSLYNTDLKTRQWIKMNEHRKFGNLKAAFVFLICVVIGFYSHIGLDAFTHKSGSFVTKYSFLQQTIAGFPVYKLLQHTLSLIGLTLEAWFLINLLKRTKLTTASDRQRPHTKLRYWLLVMLITIITVALKLTFTASTNTIGIIVVSTISGISMGILLSSVRYWILRHYAVRST
ncbi:hypothetical protein SY83_21235 [Paenibacillus swuensis]|uniref:DUF4184 family protein n=1 Tax=Paenibacillus swuensis TaxID=1178515 RepID=A0A172TNC0_9BACL|nr:DUF4184 family protein [Paenibacillus swuensis]ANE48384.1 hypothetical protein SY83_21235 [Paenibacillus swuensis]